MTDASHINNVFLLRILGGKVIPLLDLYTSGYLDAKTELKLLDYFQQLTRLIEPIQTEEKAAGHDYTLPQPYEEWNGKLENVNRMWAVYRFEYISKVNLLETLWKVEGDVRLATKFKLSPKTKLLLDEIDEKIISCTNEVKTKQKLETQREQIEPTLDSMLTIWPASNIDNMPSSIKLEQKSYDAANGILAFYGEKIAIVRQSNMVGSKNEKNPAKLMRELFSVNTFPNAIPIRKIFPVTGDVYPPNVIKSANTLVTRINKLISDKTPAKNLIAHDKFRFYIDSRYLK